MKIKTVILSLVLLGSCPVPAVAWGLAWPEIPQPNRQKIVDGIAEKVTWGVLITAFASLYQVSMHYLIPTRQEEIDAQNKQSILKTQAIIINNDNSLNSYEQQLAKLRQMCVVYKDEQLCKQCEELDKDRINMILANAYLKNELAKKLRAHQEKEMRAAQQSPLTAKAAPAAK